MTTHRAMRRIACFCAISPMLASGALAEDAVGEEILVTARKRTEEAAQVPVIATVIEAEELDSAEVDDLFDIASLTPGLVLGPGPMEVGTEVSLRGIGAAPLDPGVDQSIALNLDGLPLGQGAAYAAGLFDMARVEVLKGPQPLFFGKNSPGGVIAIRTADPGTNREISSTAAFEAEARELQASLVLSGPVTDSLGLRLATRYSTGDGYFRNAAIAVPGSGAAQPRARIGHSENLYVRLTGLFQPNDKLTARLKLNATSERSLGGIPAQLTNCPDGTFNYLPTIGLDLPSQFSSNEDCKADRTVYIVDMDPRFYSGLPNQGVAFTDSGQRYGTLDLTWNVAPQISLTSISGYYQLDIDALQNGPWAGGAGPPLAIIKAFSREEITQELRLASDFEGPFDFVAGGFFQDGQIRSDITLPGNSAYGLPETVLKGSHDVRIRSYALFGQARVRPVSQVELAGGVRWTDERRSDSPITYDVFGVFTGIVGEQVFPKVRDLHSANWSPEVTVSWFPRDGLTLFAAFRQGYKSGSYNITLPLNPGDDNSFDDERGRGGEIGLKGYTADRQFHFDLAAYHYDYNQLQVGIIRVTDTGIPTLATLNAGAARVEGVDLSVRFRPQMIQGLSLSAAANWNDGIFTRFSDAACHAGQTIAEGCALLPTPVTDPSDIAAGYYAFDPVIGGPARYNAQDLSGSKLPRAPTWQGSFRSTYEATLRQDLRFLVEARVELSSSYVVDITDRTEAVQPSYAKLGATVRLGRPDGRWELALIGNNLTDKRTAGTCFNTNYPAGAVFPGMVTGAPIRGPAGSGETLCALGRGRELWLRLSMSSF